nr:cilia- and flagella-associated protein HOATZ [Nothobranchius furzeri]
MSQQAFSPDNFGIMFAGSSPEDVSHARQLWSSVSLPPPLESRLVSEDIHQRLPVSRPKGRGLSAAPVSRPSVLQPPDVSVLLQKHEERRRYEAMADQRKEIMALLMKQRERRLQKELLSAAVKISNKPQEDPDSELEKELVKQLQ